MFASPVSNAAEARTFKALYLEKYDIELSDEEALERLTHLVQFYYLTRGYELHKANESFLERNKVTPPKLDEWQALEAWETALEANLSY